MLMIQQTGLRKYIGNRNFYRLALGIALPIIFQNLVTSFVSLLDNIMVGQCGTAAMSAVAVSGQLMFNYMVIIFGVVSGPGIFCAQFYGAGDREGLRASFRTKLLGSVILALACFVLFQTAGESLVRLFLTGDEADRAEVLTLAMGYLRIMSWMTVPFAVASAYASTLRETGRTLMPMVASVAAVGINLFFNWVLIFGKLGAPALGVVGAAIATVTARVVEMLIVVIYSHRHAGEVFFPQKLFARIPQRKGLMREILKRSFPLFINEFLWSTGTSFVVQVYSSRGLDVVAALNIGYVVLDLFQVTTFSIGNTIAILVGQQLGAGELERAVDTDRKLMAFGLVLSLVMAGVFCLIAPYFPRLYNTSEEVRLLASRLMYIMAAVLPFGTIAHASYFTVRCGGKTLVTFVFDSCFMWVVNIPAAWLAAHLTDWSILLVYACSNSTDLIKAAIGLVLVSKKVWVVSLTDKGKKKAPALADGE